MFTATVIKPLVLNNNLRKVGSNPQLHNSSLSASVLRKSPSADIFLLNSGYLNNLNNLNTFESNGSGQVNTGIQPDPI